EFERRVQELTEVETFDVLIAPAHEKDGHEQHEWVADLADALAAERHVIRYRTYSRTHGRVREGTEVEPDSWMIPRKLRAVACHESQMDPRTGCQIWFLDGIREWVEPAVPATRARTAAHPNMLAIARTRLTRLRGRMQGRQPAVVSGLDFRALEKETIRAFVARAAREGLLAGDVLAPGCGRQPYRDVIENGGGSYHPYDRAELPANVSREDIGSSEPLASSWNAILSTQMLQYVVDPQRLLMDYHTALVRRGGVLVMTGPASWPIVDAEDLWRFTPAGLERMLRAAGIGPVEVRARGTFSFGGLRRW